MNKKLLLVFLTPLYLSAIPVNKIKTFFFGNPKSSRVTSHFSKDQFDGDLQEIKRLCALLDQQILSPVPLANQTVNFLYKEVDEYWCSEKSDPLTRDNFKKWIEGKNE